MPRCACAYKSVPQQHSLAQLCANKTPHPRQTGYPIYRVSIYFFINNLIYAQWISNCFRYLYTRCTTLLSVQKGSIIFSNASDKMFKESILYFLQVAVLHLREADKSGQTECLQVLDTGARDALSDVIVKVNYRDQWIWILIYSEDLNNVSLNNTIIQIMGFY